MGYFDLGVAAQIGYCARGYRLTTGAAQLCEGYFKHSLSLTWENIRDHDRGSESADGSTFKFPTSAIKPYTLTNEGQTGGKTRFREERKLIKAAVEVDGNALLTFHNAAEAWIAGEAALDGFSWVHEFYDSLVPCSGPKGGRAAAEERAKRGITQASMLLDAAKRSKEPGYVVCCTYSERNCGRLYAEGGLTLQGCLREVRRAALRGCYDVDVDNCHATILSQIVKPLGLATPVLDSYLRDKRCFRQMIAEETDLSERDVKELLIALIFGAKLTVIPGGKGELQELLGIDALKRVAANKDICALQAELRKAQTAVINDYRFRNKHVGPNFIVNDARHKLKVRGASSGQKLAFILQGAESEILKACIRFVPDLCLLAHDGFVAREQVDLTALETFVAGETGYQVTFTQTLL